MSQVFPPAILGHDEQELLKNSGHPAAAWVHECRVINSPTPDDPNAKKFQCRMGDAPGSVARLINRRAYRKTSAEIYDEPPDGCRIPNVKGKVLRAVAFLGREIPRVKRLEDIPQFNEKTGASTDWVDVFATGTYDGVKYTPTDLEDMARNYKLLCNAGINPSKFSESGRGAAAGACRRVFMDTPAPAQGATDMDELRQKLIAAGMPQDVVTAMDDAALQAFAQACASFAAPAAAAPEGGATTPAATNGDGGPMSQGPETKVTAPVAAGATPTDAKTYAEIESRVTRAVLAGLKQSGTSAEALAARMQDIDQTSRRRVFSEKAEHLIKSGKIAPSVNEGDLILSIALDLDSTKLRKFGDGDKSLEARFSLLLDRLAGQTLPKIGEKAPSGEVDARKFSEKQKDAEVEKVTAFYRKHSDRFAVTGTDEATYVGAFKHLQKDRAATAEDYTGERD